MDGWDEFKRIEGDKKKMVPANKGVGWVEVNSRWFKTQDPYMELKKTR